MYQEQALTLVVNYILILNGGHVLSSVCGRGVSAKPGFDMLIVDTKTTNNKRDRRLLNNDVRLFMKNL